MRRIVFFTRDMHNGTSEVGFWAEDISAARQELIDRGVRMSKIMSGGGLTCWERKDPDGNSFQIPDRP